MADERKNTLPRPHVPHYRRSAHAGNNQPFTIRAISESGRTVIQDWIVDYCPELRSSNEVPDLHLSSRMHAHESGRRSIKRDVANLRADTETEHSFLFYGVVNDKLTTDGHDCQPRSVPAQGNARRCERR